MENLSVLHFTGDNFGARVLELAGRVIDPGYQAKGIGSRMLSQYLEIYPADFIATYTRNPSVLKMMNRSVHALYPLAYDTELKNIALAMPHASEGSDSAVYHFGRYDESGLFQSGDPAERLMLTNSDKSLKQLFPGLQNERNALIISARAKREVI